MERDEEPAVVAVDERHADERRPRALQRVDDGAALAPRDAAHGAGAVRDVVLEAAAASRIEALGAGIKVDDSLRRRIKAAVGGGEAGRAGERAAERVVPPHRRGDGGAEASGVEAAAAEVPRKRLDKVAASRVRRVVVEHRVLQRRHRARRAHRLGRSGAGQRRGVGHQQRGVGRTRRGVGRARHGFRHLVERLDGAEPRRRGRGPRRVRAPRRLDCCAERLERLVLEEHRRRDVELAAGVDARRKLHRRERVDKPPGEVEHAHGNTEREAQRKDDGGGARPLRAVVKVRHCGVHRRRHGDLVVEEEGFVDTLNVHSVGPDQGGCGYFQPCAKGGDDDSVAGAQPAARGKVREHKPDGRGARVAKGADVGRQLCIADAEVCAHGAEDARVCLMQDELGARGGPRRGSEDVGDGRRRRCDCERKDFRPAHGQHCAARQRERIRRARPHHRTAQARARPQLDDKGRRRVAEESARGSVSPVHAPAQRVRGDDARARVRPALDELGCHEQRVDAAGARTSNVERRASGNGEVARRERRRDERRITKVVFRRRRRKDDQVDLGARRRAAGALRGDDAQVAERRRFGQDAPR
mmetsp:Transcript_23244/g.83039  ORF Transcript_23244/g.83039 Transcript_23244/m.83039 type:complete len:587 (+) Transcript_23244:915-2675(+)